MGEKLYKPIIKDGDHLVRSSKNPERVRGQTRDENNKNPDIIEWEEIDVENIKPKKSREEIEYELEMLAAEEDLTKRDKTLSALDSINTGLELLNNFLIILQENPEIVRAIVKGGKWVKNTVASGVNKTISVIKSAFSGARMTRTEEIPKVNELSNQQHVSGIGNPDMSFIMEDPYFFEDPEREEMSIEEARTLILDTLSNFVQMKKNLARLSKAKINDINVPVLDIEQVIPHLDALVVKFPALMDERTSISVLDILNGNCNSLENRRILDVLKIEQHVQ